MGEPVTPFAIIIPVLDEAAALPATLAALNDLDPAPDVWVVDGGSEDETWAIAETAPGVRTLRAARGRAVQMNAGAAQATTEWLLFLHADTVLPPTSYRAACDVARAGHVSWGWFDVRFDDPRLSYRTHAWLISQRTRVRGTPTGDQAIFVRREVFEAVGGFPELPLMEDVAFVRRLRGYAPGRRIDAAIVTSARRWREHGLLRTILRMWWLKTQYLAGRDPQRLAERYADVR